MESTLRQPTKSAQASAFRAPVLGDTERLISGALGTVAVLRGLRRGGAMGGLTLLTGVALLGRGVSGYCPLTTAVRAKPAEQGIAQEHGWRSAGSASASVTIGRDAEEVYRFIRDPANVPVYMTYVDRVEPRDNGLLWHWTANVPGFGTVEWDSRVTEDRTGELFAWESQRGATLSIANRIELRHAPAGRGTEVHMRLDIQPPGGVLGAALARLTGHGVGWQAASDLRRLKQLLETGEIPTPALRRADASSVASS